MRIMSSACCAADSEAIDSKRWLTYADRHALAFLAAGAHASVQRHVIADHADASECIGTIANDGRAFNRIGDLTVFDHVSLGGREHELSADDIDLAATEVHCVQA